MSHQPEPPSADLLAAALREPLPARWAGSAINEWFRSLQRAFPLWSFEPFAYHQLHDTDLATTFPLQAMIDSILEDDGVPAEPPEPIEPPLATIDRRRGWLAGTATLRPHFRTRVEWVEEDGERLRLTPVPRPQLIEAPELFHPGTEGEHYFDSPRHEATEAGRELARRYEEREAARAADEETLFAAARGKLTRILKRLRINVGRGGARKGPPDPLLDALVQEARDLFSLCWDVYPFEPPEDVCQVLMAHDVDPEECWVWTVNLVLPILSGHEVRVLGEQIHAASDWSRPWGRPTPARLAACCAAHRLGMTPGSIGDTALGGATADELRRMENPF